MIEILFFVVRYVAASGCHSAHSLLVSYLMFDSTTRLRYYYCHSSDKLMAFIAAHTIAMKHINCILQLLFVRVSKMTHKTETVMPSPDMVSF